MLRLQGALMDVAVVEETISRSHTLRLALWRGKAVFLWVAVPVVFGIGMWQVYLREEVLLLPLSPRLYSEPESSQIDSKKQSALSKGTRKGD
jgi:hypothetical protein